jgi:site-specific recombinase XerD
MNGASLLEIAAILGHRRLATTQRYAHLTTEHLRGVAARMTAHVFGEGDRA